MITIVPEDNLVVISGKTAWGVDMTGVDPDIHAIQFNEIEDKGTIEFKSDPQSPIVPPDEYITSIQPWDPQVEQAERIIYCRENPKTYYTTTGSVIGIPVVVDTEDWPQPPDTTAEIPPAQPTSNTVLYWSGTEFIWSAYPIDLPLADAKAYLSNSVDATAYSLLQPSDWYVVRQNENGTPIPVEWNTWRQEIRDEAAAKRLVIDGEPTLDDLRAYSQSQAYLTWPPSPAG